MGACASSADAPLAQVALVVDVAFEVRALEGDLRVVRGVEEVGPAQVRVAAADTGVDARRVDLDLRAAGIRTRLVPGQRRVDRVEPTTPK